MNRREAVDFSTEPLTLRELAKLVRRTRDAQNAYFRSRERDKLAEAQRLEAEVDRVVASILDPSLF